MLPPPPPFSKKKQDFDGECTRDVKEKTNTHRESQYSVRSPVPVAPRVDRLRLLSTFLAFSETTALFRTVVQCMVYANGLYGWYHYLVYYVLYTVMLVTRNVQTYVGWICSPEFGKHTYFVPLASVCGVTSQQYEPGQYTLTLERPFRQSRTGYYMSYEGGVRWYVRWWHQFVHRLFELHVAIFEPSAYVHTAHGTCWYLNDQCPQTIYLKRRTPLYVYTHFNSHYTYSRPCVIHVDAAHSDAAC